MISQQTIFGKSIPRSDASRLLRGKGHYVDDIQLPRMVHAVFLRSPHAHAKIISIDIKEAEKAKGLPWSPSSSFLNTFHSS